MWMPSGKSVPPKMNQHAKRIFGLTTSHAMARHYGNMPSASFRSTTSRFASGFEKQMQGVLLIANAPLQTEQPGGPSVGSYFYAAKLDARGETTLARRTLSLWGLPVDKDLELGLKNNE